MLNGRNREIIDFAGRVSDVSKRMGYSAGLLLLFLLSLTSLPVVRDRVNRHGLTGDTTVISTIAVRSI